MYSFFYRMDEIIYIRENPLDKEPLMTVQTSPSRSSRFSAIKTIVLCLLVGFSSVAFAQSTYLTSKEPAKTSIDGAEYYQISKCPELAWFRDQVNVGHLDINAILTKDVNCYANTEMDTNLVSNWVVIGDSVSHAYNGIFDGAGHSIKNIAVLKESNLFGLFGYVSGTVKNLRTDNFFYEISRFRKKVSSSPSSSDCKSDVYPVGRSRNSLAIGGIAAVSISGAVFDNVIAENFVYDRAFETSYSRLCGLDSVEGILVGKATGTVFQNLRRKLGSEGLNFMSEANTVAFIGQIDNSIVRNSKMSVQPSIWKIGSNSRIVNSIAPMRGSADGMVFENCAYRDEFIDSFVTHEDSNYIGNNANESFRSGEKKGLWYPRSDESHIQFAGYTTGPALMNEWVMSHGEEDYSLWDGDSFASEGYVYKRAAWTDKGNFDLSWYSPGKSSYTIENIRQLAGLSVIVNGFHGMRSDDFSGKTIVLANDLKETDVGKLQWRMIGFYSKRFNGIFDGNGKSISGLLFDSLSAYSTLFGINGGVIKNLRVDKARYRGSWGAGIALINLGTIDNCVVNVDMETYLGAAGIAVQNTLNGVVKNSSYTGHLSVYNPDSMRLQHSRSTVSEYNYLHTLGGITIWNSGLLDNVSSSGTLDMNANDQSPNNGSIAGISSFNMSKGIIKGASTSMNLVVYQYPEIGYSNSLARVYTGLAVGLNKGGVLERVVSLADSAVLYDEPPYLGLISMDSAGQIDKVANHTKYIIHLSELDDNGINHTKKGFTYVGGIVGYERSGNISNSYNVGSLEVDFKNDYDVYDYKFAGIVGGGKASYVNNSYNVGKVDGVTVPTSTGKRKKQSIASIYGIGNSSYIYNSYSLLDLTEGALTRYYGLGEGAAYNSYALDNTKRYLDGSDAYYSPCGSVGELPFKYGYVYDECTVDLSDNNSESYLIDFDMAQGVSEGRYYNMEDGEEVQGTLLEALNHWVDFRYEYVGDSYARWKQGDAYPELDIEWNGVSSSSVVSSSSSAKQESSSSEAKSSSSEKSSSSSAKSSSSEQSSSSSAEQESSSSEEHTTVVMATPQKAFNLAVNGMTIALSNTQGGNVRIFDALGHLVVSKPLSATGMTAITMQTSGSYIIRVNGMSQKVLLK